MTCYTKYPRYLRVAIKVRGSRFSLFLHKICPHDQSYPETRTDEGWFAGQEGGRGEPFLINGTRDIIMLHIYAYI